ncbi:hypothetical protein HPB51_005221 [Rhipicephalus microplus]|uniref:Uncharacterized protein n=1 Tax=Rhipicephalus microplus TaxID=6941 RepID=A0A9J6DZV1_RHIMP|nr:hypothetical protein HPB51_005221 [Rhipicephalus microplus]
MLSASFGTIVDVYNLEVGQLLRHAYTLSRKALFPSNLEKQNVKLALQVLNDTVPPAVREIGGKNNLCHVEGTATFIEIMVKWWKIVNVKTPSKGARLRDEFQEPVFSLSDRKVDFLYNLLDWMEEWKERTKGCDSGTLTKETHAALYQTTQGLIEISRYCLDELKLTYVLLGKIQTDCLEDRFGKYRQLAGAQYHVSIRQVYECENKLRLQSTLPTVVNTVSVSDPDEQWQDLDSEANCSGPGCNVVVTEETLSKMKDIIPVLVYVAGYAAYAALKKLKCDKCREALTLNKEISVSVADKHYDLIRSMDRGGLVHPAMSVVNAVAHNYCRRGATFTKQSVFETLKPAASFYKSHGGAADKRRVVRFRHLRRWTHQRGAPFWPNAHIEADDTNSLEIDRDYFDMLTCQATEGTVAKPASQQVLLKPTSTDASNRIRPQVHYAHMPKGVGSADICRELVKHFKLSELKCVQKYGMGKFEVTFANDEASRRFSDNPVLAIHDARIRFQYRGVRVKVVRVIGFPADADVCIIAQLLGMYGVVLDVSREESAFLLGVLSGILVVRMEMHKSVRNLHQFVLKCEHCGGDHGSSECKAQTNSSAAPPVASSSQEQVSGVAEDREATPGDAKGSTQPQPEPISERAPGGEKQEAGLKLAKAPTLSAAAEPSPASPAGASETSPADAPFAENKEEPMSWTDAVRGKKRRAGRSPGPSKERLAAALSGGPGSQKDDLPVVKRPAATV